MICVPLIYPISHMHPPLIRNKLSFYINTCKLWGLARGP